MLFKLISSFKFGCSVELATEVVQDKEAIMHHHWMDDCACAMSQSCFTKVGHLHVYTQSKRGWEPQIFYSYFVMSQLSETEIP
jgi:hypothetical protein